MVSYPETGMGLFPLQSLLVLHVYLSSYSNRQCIIYVRDIASLNGLEINERPSKGMKTIQIIFIFLLPYLRYDFF
jgi:hypothetical protein